MVTGATSDEARTILLRDPRNLSLRASYGWEERSEVVTVDWVSGAQRVLVSSQSHRISFALRDLFDQHAPACEQQLDPLVRELGLPISVSGSWRYESTWEGAERLDQRGHVRLPWTEVAELFRSQKPG